MEESNQGGAYASWTVEPQNKKKKKKKKEEEEEEEEKFRYLRLLQLIIHQPFDVVLCKDLRASLNRPYTFVHVEG